MVNLGCDGSHKKRDLLSLLRRDSDIERVNATFLVNRRPPSTIAVLRPNCHMFHDEADQHGTIESAARHRKTAESHVTYGRVPRRNCMAPVALP